MAGQGIVTIGESRWAVDVANTPAELYSGLGGLESVLW